MDTGPDMLSLYYSIPLHGLLIPLGGSPSLWHCSTTRRTVYYAHRNKFPFVIFI